MFKGLSRILGLILKSDLLLPFVLLSTYIVFLVIVRGVAPTSEELILTFASLYSKYGYEIIFIGALLEASVLVNFFVPGTVAVAMGAIFAKTGQLELTLAILFAFIGTSMGYILDYVLGYLGLSDIFKKMGYKWILDSAKERLKELGHRGLIISFFNPTVASYVSFVAGTINFGFWRFLAIALVSTFIWLSFWAILFYSIGDILIHLITKYSFLVLLLAIAGIFLARFWKGKSDRRSS